MTTARLRGPARDRPPGPARPLRARRRGARRRWCRPDCALGARASASGRAASAGRRSRTARCGACGARAGARARGDRGRPAARLRATRARAAPERALAGLGVPVTRLECAGPRVPRVRAASPPRSPTPTWRRASAGYLERLARGTHARLEVRALARRHRHARAPRRASRCGSCSPAPPPGSTAARDVARACGLRARAHARRGRHLAPTARSWTASCRAARGARSAGFPVLLPLLDVHTVGRAAARSRAWTTGGLLEVGPGERGRRARSRLLRARRARDRDRRAGGAGADRRANARGRRADAGSRRRAHRAERRSAARSAGATRSRRPKAWWRWPMPAWRRRCAACPVERGHDPRECGAGGVRRRRRTARLRARRGARHAGGAGAAPRRRALGARAPHRRLAAGAGAAPCCWMRTTARRCEREWQRLERAVRREFAPPSARACGSSAGPRCATAASRTSCRSRVAARSPSASISSTLRRFGFASRELPVQVVTQRGARGWLLGERAAARAPSRST